MDVIRQPHPQYRKLRSRTWTSLAWGLVVAYIIVVSGAALMFVERHIRRRPSTPNPLEVRARGDMAALQDALAQYSASTGDYPTTAQGLGRRVAVIRRSCPASRSIHGAMRTFTDMTRRGMAAIVCCQQVRTARKEPWTISFGCSRSAFRPKDRCVASLCRPVRIVTS